MIKLLIIYIASSFIAPQPDSTRQDASFRAPVMHNVTADICTATVFKPLVLDTDSKAYMMDPMFNSQPELNWILEEEVCSGKRREA